MSNYTKLTDFASKDALPTGTPAKIAKGTEIDDELQAIEDAIATKADLASPTFTGTPLAPTAAAGTDNTQIATTAFVTDAVDTAVTSSETATASYLVPSGAVMSFAMITPPTGWLKCDGSAISRTTYSALFTAIGEVFGVGDGSTTFNLPDLRGEFVRGYDDGKGTDSGRTFGSEQTDELKSHSHTQRINGADRDMNTSGTYYYTAGTNFNVSIHNANHTTDATGGTETRPRNIALMYCIKF